ncbi:hypothetical protein B0H14DRAFT_2586822 [Mycena olivaceomarginata]|nr:hypothetical protein B0H14DRAFT_2586822 [Mycena olivaceomarginata]
MSKNGKRVALTVVSPTAWVGLACREWDWASPTPTLLVYTTFFINGMDSNGLTARLSHIFLGATWCRISARSVTSIIKSVHDSAISEFLSSGILEGITEPPKNFGVHGTRRESRDLKLLCVLLSEGRPQRLIFPMRPVSIAVGKTVYILGMLHKTCKRKENPLLITGPGSDSVVRLSIHRVWMNGWTATSTTALTRQRAEFGGSLLLSAVFARRVVKTRKSRNRSRHSFVIGVSFVRARCRTERATRDSKLPPTPSTSSLRLEMSTIMMDKFNDSQPFFRPQAGANNNACLGIGTKSKPPQPQIGTRARGNDEYEERLQGESGQRNCLTRRRLINCRDFLWTQAVIDNGRYCIRAMAFFNEDYLPETLEVLE